MNIVGIGTKVNSCGGCYIRPEYCVRTILDTETQQPSGLIEITLVSLQDHCRPAASRGNLTNQRIEAKIGFSALKQMTSLGAPVFAWIRRLEEEDATVSLI